MSEVSEEMLATLSRLAIDLADAAANQTVKRFRSSELSTANKLDGNGFDPVTAADRQSEAAIREILSRERPEDGVFGEEEANTTGTSGLTWVVDPIDGTRAFISGLPTWGTLIALDDGQRGRIGVVDQPYIQERFVGILGSDPEAMLIRSGEKRAIATRIGVGLAQATFFTTDPFLFLGAEYDAFTEIRSRARLTRFGTDCYAYALLAMGQIDVVVESGLQPYDIAALIPLIHAAGGVVSDWSGNDCRWGGQVVAAGSAELHAELLEILAPAATSN